MDTSFPDLDPPADRPGRVDLHAILQSAVTRGASDIHLKVGRPPVVRFDGDLEPLVGFPPLGSEDLEYVLQAVGASSRSRPPVFEETAGHDTAYPPARPPPFRGHALKE